MRILLFGGTTEGRILAQELTRRGHQVTVSVATALGAEELAGIPCTVWQGRMDEQEMSARVCECDLVIDATHPYAEEASRNIRAACDKVGVSMRRVLREASDDISVPAAEADAAAAARGSCVGTAGAGSAVSYDYTCAVRDTATNRDCVRVDSCKAAAEYLQNRPGNVLITTGSKALLDYACLTPERLYPRVLPTHEALNICEEMGIPHRNILAMQGPFPLEMNVAMLRQYDIAYLVTKDGGRAGGFSDKLAAARQTGVQLLLVGRPADSGESMEQLLRELEGTDNSSGLKAMAMPADLSSGVVQRRKCTLIGMGCGPAHLTQAAWTAIQEADLLVGARRVLELVPERGAWSVAGNGSEICGTIQGTSFVATGIENCVKNTAQRIAEYRPHEIAALLQATKAERVCVLYSGDSGFYSGAAGLLPLLQEIEGLEIQVMPGISSLQAFAALLGEAWQDWNLCSAHGVSCDPIQEVMRGKKTFFLTAGSETPGEICSALTEAGLGMLGAAVGENLGTTKEARVFRGTAAECACKTFASLNVMLVDAAPRYPVRTSGIPDDAFVREQVPMTKQEVRAAILAKLAVTPEDVCWDVGAGTGSVSVELALHSRSVWAVEQKAEAVRLIWRNREAFCAWNLRVVEGTAPEALADLPRPDVVFVGGSSGQLEAILQAAVEANPRVRICVSAIALETLHEAATVLEQLGRASEVTQIAVSRTRVAGELHLLMAQNPVFLITGRN